MNLDCGMKTAVQNLFGLGMYRGGGIDTSFILKYKCVCLSSVLVLWRWNINYHCHIFSMCSDKIPEDAKEEAGQHWELWDSQGGLHLPFNPRWIYCCLYLLFVRRSPMEGKSGSNGGLKLIIHLLITMKRFIGMWKYIYSDFSYLDLYNPHTLYSPVLYIILTCFAKKNSLIYRHFEILWQFVIHVLKFTSIWFPDFHSFKK